jgi:hypothetical protein
MQTAAPSSSLSDVKLSGSPLFFRVNFVPAGTGTSVWDDPNAKQVIHKFLTPERKSEPTIGILYLGSVHPTPNVLWNTVVAIGEDVRARRYGDNFSFVVSSEDVATRGIVQDIASSQALPVFVTSSLAQLERAEPAGPLTVKDRETLNLVLSAGGTVTAAELGEQLGVEQTTAGNRLIALNKKGYLQRVERPHPLGDQFIDPRSIRLYF